MSLLRDYTQKKKKVNEGLLNKIFAGWQSMRIILKVFLVQGLLLFCACAPSYHNQVVTDRNITYHESLEAFKEKENEFLILLGNLERYPEDVFLLQRKKEVAMELNQLRNLVKLSRKELDDSIEAWEAAIAQGKVDTESMKEILKNFQKKGGRMQDRPEWKGFE
jgi:hypothetical protein